MSNLIPLFQPGIFAAGADLSADKLKFVRASAVAVDSTTVILIAGVTEIPVGILQNKPDAVGKSAKVMTAGVGPCIAGSAITVGDPVGPDAAGLADTKVLGTDVTNFVVGQALDTVGAGGAEVVTLLFDCSKPVRAA